MVVKMLKYAAMNVGKSIITKLKSYLASIKYNPKRDFGIPDPKGGVELPYVKATKKLKIGEQIILESEDRTRYARQISSQLGRRLECRKMSDGSGWKCWRTS